MSLGQWVPSQYHPWPPDASSLGHWGGILVWWVWQSTSDKTSWPTGWWHVMLTCSSTTLDHKMSVLGWGEVGLSGEPMGGLGVLGDLGGYIWKMKTVYCKVLVKTHDGLLHTTEHELRSMWPKFIPLLATRCHCQGDMSDWKSVWPKG